MKCCTDSFFFQVRDQSASYRKILYFNVIHMCIVDTAFRNKGSLDLALFFQISEAFVVGIIDLVTFLDRKSVV